MSEQNENGRESLESPPQSDLFALVVAGGLLGLLLCESQRGGVSGVAGFAIGSGLVIVAAIVLALLRRGDTDSLRNQRPASPSSVESRLADLEGSVRRLQKEHEHPWPKVDLDLLPRRSTVAEVEDGGRDA